MESRKETYIFFGIVAVLILLGSVVVYPIMQPKFPILLTGAAIENNPNSPAHHSKTPQEYYDMFKCSCCGQPISADCCGMAKERKAQVDQLLLEEVDENELVYQMVKKFGLGILMDTSKEQQVKDYIQSKASDNPPKIKIDNTLYNFGTVSQSEGIVTTTFNIQNTGESDLIIEGIDTSCMCTSASIIYNGEEGPKFGMSMHGNNPKDYSLTIPKGKSAQLKVYYDPMAHGKQDKPEAKIIREVTIKSNDPVDFQKKVRIELTQVP